MKKRSVTIGRHLARLLVASTIAPLALALGGCPDDALLEACTSLCEQRIACDEKNGNTSTKQSSCETACIPTHGDDFVKKSEECKDKSACEYTACVEP